ncbi:arylesterase [Pedobacter sp. AW31-3R]|uniref:arylesterase n=1 Tax=Pedobacter sp. AW31-3R TaxID=3445781 RepID=UPI003FA0F307
MQQIIFFGDSLTQGYGLKNALLESFPSIIQQKIDALGLPYRIVNAGISGDTSLAGLLRLDGILNQQTDVFVLALGANDMLRGTAAATTFSHLQQIIDQVKSRHPQVKLLLLGMQLPVWVPGLHAAEFREIYQRIADENQMEFVPFLLEGVAGISHLNMADGIHPLMEGYTIIAENVWSVLKPML